jgi:hypothetical protein
MIVTRKTLSRRTVLRGIGVSLGLPFLDAMVPAFAATPRMPRRLGFFYQGNGCNVAEWMPKGEGTTFEFGNTMKEVLTPFRKKLLVITGLYDKCDSSGDGGGAHTRAQAGFLSGTKALQTDVNPVLAKTADQYAADIWGRETPLPSLELSLEGTGSGKTCDHAYSCAYRNLSWRSATQFNPPEMSPRQVFERLFGDGGTPADRTAELRNRASILDGLLEQARRLGRKLGAGDRQTIAQYFEDVRVIEQRIQRAEAQASAVPVSIDRPDMSIPPSYTEYSYLMHDLLAAAYQSNVTRVATMLVSQEISSRAYPEIGVNEAHHSVSHHAQNPEFLAQYAKIDVYKLSHFARFLTKLDAMPEGDGTVLDHSLFLYGGGISDGDSHNPANVPIVLAGGGGTISCGRAINYDLAKLVPLANLLVTILQASGLPLDRLGNSDGKLVEPLAL